LSAGHEEAAAVAAAKFAAVRERPDARLALARGIYDDQAGRLRRLPYKRAALSFMRWEARRGVLNPLESPSPGSSWWRALNERLLRDGCEAVSRAEGHGGPASSPTIELWARFVERPSARSWYLAHNASIVSAYLEHLDLAERENRVERFFLNVVLARVLYAHALVAAPRLALGRLAVLGRPLGDPRVGMVGLFLAMGRVLPDRYPAEGDLETYLRAEHAFGRVLDYGVVLPRLEWLYSWSAAELGRPELADLVVDGTPAYAWSPSDRSEWSSVPVSKAAGAVRTVTARR
jgi:hypothetical protein